MDLTALRPLISATPLADVAACRAELADVTVARGLLDARELEVVRRLDELAATDASLFPQDVVAKASRSSLSHAERLRERAKAAAAVPELGEALADGATTGDRLDTVARATAGLSASEREAVAALGPRLALAAGEQTAARFRQTVEHVVAQARKDDGLAKLERQRRSARLRWWLDADGNWNLAGRFDPATGARMEGRLRNQINRIRARRLPENCPTDPLELQQHLAALALAELMGVSDTALDGESADESGVRPAGPVGGGGSPDVTVIIDEQTLREGHQREGSIVDIGLGGFGLPVETIRRWACTGSVTPVIVSADGVRLILGRETRVANRAQRRALRVLYRTCSLCDTPFDLCQIHHVDWFALGGLTNIECLLPVCSKHHHLVHEGGWVLHLAADRTLTVTRPGGIISVHPPPNAKAA